MTVPAYELPVWVDGRVTNKGDVPLWSGKAPPPEIGTTVIASGRIRHEIMVTGYKVDGGWLMIEGYRINDPGFRGDLAGAEIVYSD